MKSLVALFSFAALLAAPTFARAEDTNPETENATWWISVNARLVTNAPLPEYTTGMYPNNFANVTLMSVFQFLTKNKDTVARLPSTQLTAKLSRHTVSGTVVGPEMYPSGYIQISGDSENIQPGATRIVSGTLDKTDRRSTGNYLARAFSRQVLDGATVLDISETDERAYLVKTP